MRPLLTIVAVVVLLLIVGVATGFINLSSRGGDLPEVKVEGGALPKVDADVGDVDVGTKNETVNVKVPTIDVDTAKQDASEDKDK
ncbi:hypothetical protein HJG53_09225 [Sphingomonas sp. ID1715]|uniref:hypothetical protein n=1 Tax=Sphingomonas sp. ID1715 TaxID=1656898 RepID=UPI0014896F35|nr:hypothetical protein [Sphingomonas sp. ID1715]NNM77081.1 hypothetical protein [Sphingomonas sp. ID1715]